MPLPEMDVRLRNIRQARNMSVEMTNWLPLSTFNGDSPVLERISPVGGRQRSRFPEILRTMPSTCCYRPLALSSEQWNAAAVKAAEEMDLICTLPSPFMKTRVNPRAISMTNENDNFMLRE